jgi:hypothetical protein
MKNYDIKINKNIKEVKAIINNKYKDYKNIAY